MAGDQRIETVLGADGGDLPDRFDADVAVRILQQFLQAGDGVDASLADFANVLGANVLCHKSGAGQQKRGR